MFVQIISGKATDEQALEDRMTEWTKSLQGGAQGWRGTTAGAAADGTFVALAMFESEEAARRNSDRSEQGEWWAQTEPLIQNPTFIDATEVTEFLGGPDPTAGFVQVMQGRLLDADAAAQMMDGMEDSIREARPDVTGMVLARHGDRFTQAVYFTDEAAAREGERKEGPDSGPDPEEMQRVFADISYIDLTRPWHAQP